MNDVSIFATRFEELNTGLPQIAENIDKLGQWSNGLLIHVDDANAQLALLGQDVNRATPNAARDVSRKLAGQMRLYNADMRTLIDEYKKVLTPTCEALEYVASKFHIHVPDAHSSAADLVAAMESALAGIHGLRAASAGLAVTMDRLYAPERHLRREKSVTRNLLLQLVEQLESTIAAINHAINTIQREVNPTTSTIR